MAGVRVKLDESLAPVTCRSDIDPDVGKYFHHAGRSCVNPTTLQSVNQAREYSGISFLYRQHRALVSEFLDTHCKLNAESTERFY